MNLPAIPEIGGEVDILLDIYTHRSLRSPNLQMNGEYGDTDRLAVLGAAALDFSVTRHLFLLRPHVSETEIQVCLYVISESIDRWLQLYRMKEKLLVAPDARAVLDNPVEMRNYFLTFLGAVWVRNGLSAVEDWISLLINWSSLTGGFVPASSE